MKIGLISDVHGNAVALDAVLADLGSSTFDRLVCLGDAVQGGPRPAEVVARLRELACPVVLGNADDYLATGADSGAEAIDEARQRRLEAVRDWQRSRLTAEDVAFIRAFRPTVEVPLPEGRRLLCSHGSPHSYDDVILPLTPDDELRRLIAPSEETIHAGGHTHVQFVRQLGRTFHLNPGSVGFAYRHDQPEGEFRADPWAEYALLTVAGGQVALEFRRVPFDVDRLVWQYRRSGRPFADEAIAQYATSGGANRPNGG